MSTFPALRRQQSRHRVERCITLGHKCFWSDTIRKSYHSYMERYRVEWLSIIHKAVARFVLAGYILKNWSWLPVQFSCPRYVHPANDFCNLCSRCREIRSYFWAVARNWLFSTLTVLYYLYNCTEPANATKQTCTRCQATARADFLQLSQDDSCVIFCVLVYWQCLKLIYWHNLAPL